MTFTMLDLMIAALAGIILGMVIAHTAGRDVWRVDGPPATPQHDKE